MRLCLLMFIEWEDGRAILCADIIALAVELRRIMRRKKDVKQIGIANDSRIETDANRFGVPSGPRANLFVSGIRNCAADVAAFQCRNTGESLEHRLHAPETAACHYRLIVIFVHTAIFNEENLQAQQGLVVTDSLRLRVTKSVCDEQLCDAFKTVLLIFGKGKPCLRSDRNNSYAFGWLLRFGTSRARANG